MLVSSSPGLVIEPLGIYLGCTDTLTTPVVIERGRLVGLGSGPPCYGEGKRYWAEQWARAHHHVEMEDAVAYADNWSDRACSSRSAGPWSSTRAAPVAAGPGQGMGYRPAAPARPRKPGRRIAHRDASEKKGPDRASDGESGPWLRVSMS